MVRPPSLLPLALLLLTLAFPARASSAEPPMLIVTRGAGAAQCPDASQLASLVWTLGRRQVTAGSASAPVVLHVAIDRTLEGYTAVLLVRGARSGARTLSDVGPGCESIAEALALSIAIVLDATPPAPAPEPSVAAAGATAPPSVALEANEPPPTRPAAVETIEAPPSLPHWNLGPELRGGVAIGILAGPVPTLGGALGFRWPQRLGIALGVTQLTRDTVPVGTGTVALDLTLGSLAVCGVVAAQHVATASLCLEPMLGVLRGSARNFETNEHRVLPYGAFGFGPRGEGQLAGAWHWTMSAQAVAPLVRHGFRVEDAETTKQAFHAQAVGVLVQLGLRWEVLAR